MNENNIDLKVKDFSNYLLEIGLLIGSSYNDFIKKFKEINEKQKILLEDEESDENFGLTYFKDNISETMIKFYDSMNEERKKLVTYNIFNIYNKKKGENINNDLPNDNFHIDNTELISEEKNIKYEEERFEITILSSKNNLILKLNDISENSDESGTNSKENISKFKKKKKKNEKNIPKKNNEKKKEIKLKPNENCTFQPNADKKGKNEKKFDKKYILNFVDKLSKINKEKKEQNIENIRKEIEKECYFQPNLSTNRDKSKKKVSRKDFEKRLKIFEDNKKEKEKKIKKDRDDEFKKICPFVPNNEIKEKRNKSFNKSFNKEENIYKRLYEENLKIKIKNEENIKKMLDNIKDRANHPIVKHNNINYLNNRKWNKYHNMSFDRDKKYFTEEKKEDVKLFNNKRIEELYEEYKKMKREIKLENKNDINSDKIGNEINLNNDNINKDNSIEINIDEKNENNNNKDESIKSKEKGDNEE